MASMKIGGDYMRLIDADALKEIISGNSYILRDSINSMNFGMFWDGIEQAIDESPTIDAVPVVRCKDCKCWMEWTNNTGNCSRFALNWIGTDADDFCSFGERKDND